ncbi:MAG: 50S ribosomal protein L28 [Bacteroidota bacterium]
MARRCDLTGKTVLSGNNVSHANNKTRRKFLPNLQKKRIWIPEEGRFVTLRVSTSALRTLDKKGLYGMLKDLE